MAKQSIRNDENSSSKPTTDLEWTIHSLNIQGTFFERLCQEKVRQSKWAVVSTNYPVEFPKHNGPLIGEQSKLDIYAQLEKQTIVLSLLIECKKNNPEFIDWVFFLHPNNKRPKHFSGYMVVNKTVADIDWTVLRQIAPMISLDWTVTSDAWETRGKYKDVKNGIKTKTSNAAIELAAHQVSLATRSIFEEEAESCETIMRHSIDRNKPYEHKIFIPVIVTTARLFTCDFKISDINQVTGEIDFKLPKLIEHPYLIYEYPLPAHFQTQPVDRLTYLRSTNKDFGNRMDILVVNSKHLPDFLARLEKGNA